MPPTWPWEAPGANRTLTIAPVAGQTGSAVITLSVTDAALVVTTETFNVLVSSSVVLPFTDSFNRGTSVFLGPGWNINLGTPRRSTTIRRFRPAPTNIASLNGLVATNISEQAELVVHNGDQAGLIARYGGSGDTNMYAAVLDDTTGSPIVAIRKNINGVWTTLASSSVSSGTGTLRFDVVGDSLKAYFGATAASLAIVTFAEDSSLTTGGTAGFRASSGVTLDNYAASAIPTAGPPNLPFSDALASNPLVFNQLNNFNWVEYAGDYNLSSNQAVGQTTGTTAFSLATVNGVTVPDVSVQANVSFTAAGQSAGLITRFSSTTTSYYFASVTLEAGNKLLVNLYKVIGTAQTTLTTATVNGNGGLLNFQTVGTTLNLYLNGTLIATAHDTTLTTGTVGIRSTGGAGFSNFTSAAVALTPTTTVLAPISGSIVFGQPETFTASVTSTGGTLTGPVTFLDGTTVLGTGQLNTSGVATFTPNAAQLAVGASHSITAAYGPAYLASGNFAASSSAAQTQAVTPASTSISSFTSSAPVAVIGQAITFIAVVGALAPSAAQPSPGTVTFTDTTTGTTLGTSPVNSAGTAALTTTSGLTAGLQTISAVYNANADFNVSTSATLSESEFKASTLSATASPSPAGIGQTVNFVITVSGTGGPPTGNVNLYDGSTTNPPIASGTLAGGAVTIPVNNLIGGTHTIIVSYVGDNSFVPASKSITLIVNQASTATVLQPLGGSAVYGQPVTFSATVSSPSSAALGTPTGTVTFKAGKTVLGTGSLVGGVASYTTMPTQLALGNSVITAVFAANGDFAASTSSPLTQNVTASGTLTTLQPIGGASFGTPLTLSASVVSSGASQAVPTGTVTFKDGATVLGTGKLIAGTATFTTAPTQLSVNGVHSIVAYYGGATGFTVSNSGPGQSVAVTQASTTTALTTNPAGASTYGQAVTFTAAVTLTAGGTFAPAGSVSFVDSSTGVTLGKVSVNSHGIASLSYAQLPITDGDTITATFNSTNANFAGSNAAQNFVVNQANTNIALVSTPASWSVGRPIVLAVTVTTINATIKPTGTISYYDNGALVATATLVNGKASTVYTFTASGSHAITVSYTPDTGNFASNSITTAPQNVLTTTNISLTDSPNTIFVGQTVTFTASVTGINGPPTGTVSFYRGTVLLGTVTLDANGDAVFPDSAFTAGIYGITATYSGDANFSPSTTTHPISLTVKTPTVGRLV